MPGLRRWSFTWKQKEPERDPYYSNENYLEFQWLVDSVWSVQFVDSWERYRFNSACYIWNRIAVNISGTTMTKVDLDTLTVTETITLSQSPTWRIWYFWNNRILTNKGIIDFDWDFKSTFSYDNITVWDTWVVWSNSWADIYKWTVNWDTISFTKVWSWRSGSSLYWRWITYWNLWAYLLISWENNSETDTYINPSTSSVSSFSSPNAGSLWNWGLAVAWADGKLYRIMARDNGWWRLQKIWTQNEWVVWDSLGTTWWIAYWGRFWKFLWNIVSWNMNTNNWTWNWLWSNSYFINTSWTLTKVQTNAFAYDTNVYLSNWFIDEKWWLYPQTSWWWSWVILKTDKTFNNLNWSNPYLFR